MISKSLHTTQAPYEPEAFCGTDGNGPTVERSVSFVQKSKQHSPSFVRSLRWNVNIHASGQSDQKPRREIPKHNRSRQSNDVPDPLRKVKQQEQIAQESAYQRGDIDPITPSHHQSLIAPPALQKSHTGAVKANSPPGIRIRHALKIGQALSIDEVALSPARHQRRDR
jgi:hypothetical protein